MAQGIIQKQMQGQQDDQAQPGGDKIQVLMDRAREALYRKEALKDIAEQIDLGQPPATIIGMAVEAMVEKISSEGEQDGQLLITLGVAMVAEIVAALIEGQVLQQEEAKQVMQDAISEALRFYSEEKGMGAQQQQTGQPQQVAMPQQGMQ